MNNSLSIPTFSISLQGYCCVTYMKCTSGSYQFSLNTAGSATFTLAKQGTDCSEDYVGIEGKYLNVVTYHL